MRCLYGSQNLGYETPESDKDYMEFVYPSWKDILDNKCTNTEVISEDGSHTKVIDIRNLPSLIITGHFTYMQFMFSVEAEDFEDLQWFIDNRQRICKMNMFRSYQSNSHNMIGNLKKNITPKELTRCYAFLEMSKRLLLDEPFEMYNRKAYNYRVRVANFTEDELKQEADRLVQEYKDLKTSYMKYENVVDTALFEEARAEVVRLLKHKLTETKE